ncbi:inactive ubiquitin carboxyl-terminal hydrolase MINDY-4B isoform X2 [Triplophysa rosa]|uniref:inactive ubiquitin carboxyl-terminal hydrolase MINDY-4B isoform X2 n=1 Tax=Triplophysa rosa TaxID=992332 RepID=UPI002545F0F5|nr:inactive ubiquitin carboxyl-terminal hydrolase MINDY-4B isoform X2 [Triplophysa rosa]
MDGSVDNTESACSELDEILQQISDLDKWREIFNSRGLELRECNVKRHTEKTKADEDSDDTSRPTTSNHHINPQNSQLTVPYSIPQTLAVSPSLGGQPLSPELAVGGTRAIQMVVQAHVIKYLLFGRQLNSDCKMQSMKEVGEKEQRRALATALTDILWTAGEEQTATVSLVTSDRCFTPHLDYKLDSFTERLQLFTFNKKEDVRAFIYDHMQSFKEEGSHGVILFLYSLIFSRSIDRIREDFDFTTSHLLHLSLGNFVCRQALLNLLLTGRASPNVFNGTLRNDEQGEPLAHPLHGVLTRSDVGYLLWNREEAEHAKLPQVGSMLKTPKLPIWVCNVNGTYSVLFSPNRLLLSDWRMEHLFHLSFYNGQPTQSQTAMLTIDTHSHHWEEENNDTQGDPEKKFPSVEMTIRTKWEGAVIDWNGNVPFF